ncbi:MAG: hypothetical protein WAO91_04300 [Candidatus Nitrosotenuis sp.]
METSQTKRPLGITVLGWFEVIIGIIAIVAGVVFVVLAPILSSILRDEVIAANEMVTGMSMPLIGAMSALLGALLIGGGAFGLFVGIGLLKGKKWAWTLEVISSVIGIAISGFSLISDLGSGIVGLIIESLVLYYLFRPNVKEYFGKIKAAESTTPA